MANSSAPMPAGSSAPRVLVTRRLPEAVENEIAASFDATLNRDDVPPGSDALRDALTRYDGILCTVTDRIGADIIAADPLRTRILANFGVGHEHIDSAAAAARGIVVTNTPGVLTDDTADLAVALMLAAARRTGEGERLVRGGRWSGWAPTHHLGTRVTGKTLGIIGFGRIGRAVAERARRGFGMRVLVSTRSPSAAAASAAELGATLVDSIEELLAGSDFVSMHVPATPATRHLIDAAALKAMRPHAILINTARGDVVDEAALAAALREKRIAAAGLDVFEREPSVHPALLELENVVLLPHLGSATIEAREAMGRRALANLRAFFAGEPVPDPVTGP